MLINPIVFPRKSTNWHEKVEKAMGAYKLWKETLDKVQATLGQYFQDDGMANSDSPARRDGVLT